jgi:hypothetical protein
VSSPAVSDSTIGSASDNVKVTIRTLCQLNIPNAGVCYQKTPKVQMYAKASLSTLLETMNKVGFKFGCKPGQELKVVGVMHSTGDMEPVSSESPVENIANIPDCHLVVKPVRKTKSEATSNAPAAANEKQVESKQDEQVKGLTEQDEQAKAQAKIDQAKSEKIKEDAKKAMDTALFLRRQQMRKYRKQFGERTSLRDLPPYYPNGREGMLVIDHIHKRQIYFARAGETPAKIAQKVGVDVDRILYDNGDLYSRVLSAQTVLDGKTMILLPLNNGQPSSSQP